jgi:RsiW-degrading membrane proteinase PrsW (M82 family)
MREYIYKLPKIYSIIAVIFFCIVSLFLFSVSALTFISSLTSLPAEPSSKTNTMLLLAGGAFTLGLLQIPGLYFNIRQLIAGTDSPNTLLVINDWYFFPSLILFWVIVVSLGHVLSNGFNFLYGFLSLLNIFAIGLPILFFIRICLRGLDLPSQRLRWSIFGTALIIPPTLAIIFEVLATGVILLLFYFYSSSLPGMQNALLNLVNSIRYDNQFTEFTDKFAADLLFAPGAAFSALLLFSLVVPLVEEVSKILIIIPLLKRTRSEIDGFILGTLCGAAFAFTENIGFSSMYANNWAAGVTTRAIASLPHIFASGLFGFGMVQAWKDRNIKHLFFSLITAIFVHGLWNAISLGLTMNSFVPFVDNAPLIVKSPVPFLVAWIILILGALGGLIVNNIKMQKLQEKFQSEKLVYNSQTNLINPGDN